MMNIKFNSKLSRCIGVFLYLLASGFPTSAAASSTRYNIVSGSSAMFGSFNYDAQDSTFSNFNVSALFSGQTWSLAQDIWWQSGQVGIDPGFSNYSGTLNFDLTQWANNLTTTDCSGGWCITAPVDAFSLLTTNPVNWGASLWRDAVTPYLYGLHFGSYSQAYASFQFYNFANINLDVVYDQPPSDGFFQNDIGGSFLANAVPISPVPETETYAMLLAGLGLMGFVARRKKQGA